MINFEDFIEIVSEILVDEALDLAKELEKQLRKTKNVRIKYKRSMRACIILGMGLRILKSNMKNNGNLDIKIHKGQIMIRLQKDATERTPDVKSVFEGLIKIAKIWRQIRSDAGDWIEKYMNSMRHYEFKRLIRVFESLDILLIVLSKLKKS